MTWPIIIGVAVALVITAKINSVLLRPLIVAVPGVDRRGNARRIREGYILAGMWDRSHVEEIKHQGIKVVISLAQPEDSAVEALERSGVVWVPALLGANFRHGAVIRSAVSRFDPEQVMIHCEHGVDRTGNVIAHLLVKRHGWKVPDALYAMVNPGVSDLEGLGEELRSAGYRDSVRGVGEEGVGIYSLRGIGKSGGMKAHGDYIRMIRQNIVEMQ